MIDSSQPAGEHKPDSDNRRRGRKPAATPEAVREAWNSLTREGRKVTVGAVVKLTGGRRSTVQQALTELGAIGPIQVQSPIPPAIGRVWQKSLDEHTQGIQAQYQSNLDELRDLAEQAQDIVAGLEAELKQAEAECQQVRKDRDELRGQALVERTIREQAQAEAAALRGRAEAAERKAAVLGERLEAASDACQSVEAQLRKERDQHQITRQERDRSRIAEEAANRQAEVHLREFERAHSEASKVLLVKDEHIDRLCIAIEVALERNPLMEQSLREVYLLKGNLNRDEIKAPSRLTNLITRVLGKTNATDFDVDDRRRGETNDGVPF